MKKRILSTITALALCLTLLPVMVLAVEEVTAPGGQILANTGAEEIMQFFGGAAVVSDNAITLTENAVISLSYRIQFAGGEWSLNLNGAKLKGMYSGLSVISVANSGTKLTISNSGTVLAGDNTGSGGISVDNGAILCVENGVTLNVYGGSRDYAAGNAISIYFNSTLKNDGAIFATGGDAGGFMSGHGLLVEGTVNGTGTITAKGGDAPSDVGHGIFANISIHDVSVSCGTIKAEGGDSTSASSPAGHGVYMRGNSGKITLSATESLTATGGNNTNGTGGSGIHSDNTTAEISAQTLNVTGGDSGGVTLSGKFASLPDGWYTVTFNTDGGSTAPETQYVQTNGKITAPADPTKTGFTFLGWYDGEDEWNFGTGTVSADLTLTAKWEEAKAPVPYRTCDASGQNWEETTCTDYSEVSESSATWTNGWYVVDSTPLATSERIVVEGDVRLILPDNYDLRANSGITVNAGSSLTIYGQKQGTGKLYATAFGYNQAGIGGGGYEESCGTITINGGIVEAHGEDGAGIGGAFMGGGGNITINGGSVKATGAPEAAGIGGGCLGPGGTIIINGGSVKAIGGAAGIGGGERMTAEVKFSTGPDGNAVIETSSIGNQDNQSDWNAIIFQGDSGEVYGNVTLTENAEVPGGKTLTIPEGKTLTIDSGATLTNNGTILVGGTLTGSVSGGTVKYTAPEAGQGYTIDYAVETAAAASGYEISSDNSTWLSGSIIVTPGGTLSVRMAAGGAISASDATWNGLPARPAAPDSPTGGDREITGVTTGMEYRKSGGNDWTGCTGDVITGLAAGEYEVRTKAAGDAFASAVKAVTVSDLSTYSVTIQTEGSGKASASASSAAQGTQITLTATPDTGWHFKEWRVVSGSITITDSKFTMPAGAVTVKAVFEKDADPTPTTYLVTFDSQGGSHVSSQTVKMSEMVTEPAIPTRRGYNFGGWYKESNCTTAWNFSTDTVTEDITLYAKWTTKPTSGGGSSGGGYTPSRPTYPPTVEQPNGGGTVMVSPSKPSAGDKVTIRPKSDTGYEVDEVTVTDRNGKPVNITQNPDGTWFFTQPSGKVTVKVTYRPIEIPWRNPFTDVSENDWFYETVRFVQERDLMNGYSDGRFGPNDMLSRAQLAQILFNKEGRPVINYLMDFSDVSGEAWYTEAVRWAAAMGIVGGYGNGKFGPNDPITREQLVVMLWRYAGSPAATEKELHFADADKISAYALEAMRWAVENGVVGGYGDGQLDPGRQATRAQAAQMLMRFLETGERL